MKNKIIVESTTPPSNTNTLWLDMSDKNKSLKVFNNGKWEEINNTTSRLSDVVNTSEKAINQALMDSLSYGIRWKSGDVNSVVGVGNDTIRRDNPINTTEMISRYYRNYSRGKEYPQYIYQDDGCIACELHYLTEAEAASDYYFSAIHKVQLLTKDNKIYIKDYVEDPTTELTITVVDPITEGTMEQNSVCDIYIMEDKYFLGQVTIDTDGKPMAEVTLVDADAKALPDGVYLCYIESYVVRPTNKKKSFLSHTILCPQFYIKSFEDNGYKEIRISRYKIDDSWTEQKLCAITPTIFPYDNNRGGIELSSEIRTNGLNYQPITDQYPVSYFLAEKPLRGNGYMNYCEFSRIFLCLQFINAIEISADAFYEPLTLGNQVILSGIYVSSYDVKVVEKDGTSKFLPKKNNAQYDDMKPNYFRDFYLIDNGILIPMSGGGTEGACVGTIENDGYAQIQQDDTDETTALTMLKANGAIKFLFSNLYYPIQYTSESNILQDSMGTGLIKIYYE